MIFQPQLAQIIGIIMSNYTIFVILKGKHVLMQNNTILTTDHSFATFPITSTAQPSFTFGQRAVTFHTLKIITSTGKLPLLYIPKISYYFHYNFLRNDHSGNNVGQNQEL